MYHRPITGGARYRDDRVFGTREAEDSHKKKELLATPAKIVVAAAGGYRVRGGIRVFAPVATLT